MFVCAACRVCVCHIRQPKLSGGSSKGTSREKDPPRRESAIERGVRALRVCSTVARPFSVGLFLGVEGDGCVLLCADESPHASQASH